MARLLRSLIAVPLLVVGLAACGSDTLSAEDTATESEDLLEEEVGIRPDIVCPEELELEEGAETRCTLTAGDDPTEYGVTVTVGSVEGGTADLQVEVDDEPLD